MEIGARMAHVQKNDWPTLKLLAQRADEAGFDSVWVADHLEGIPDREDGFLEGWTLISALGALTTRAQVGMVICQSFRNPGLLAKMTTTLDLMTDGRLRMILAAGYWEPEYRAFGYEFPAPATRVDVLEEAIAVLRGLWDSGESTFSFSGDHFAINEAVNLPAPTRRIPFAVGGTGHRMLRLAARDADEWSCPANMLHEYPRLSSEMDALVAESQRPIRRVVSVAFRPGQEVSADQLNEVGGSPQQMVDKISLLASLGVQDLNGLVPDMATLEAMADVLPALKSVATS
jgi:alkanesulfonate monooxygenase SsuD/methylene tetrahydromethanopterin reductase-like flavin-dependent oxidoreductase (luciferase family)